MRSPKAIILTVVLFFGFIWWQSCDTKRKSDASIQMAVAIVESVPEYGQNKAFFDAKLAEFHERAFGIALKLSLIHISEPTRRYAISYAVFCLKKKK